MENNMNVTRVKGTVVSAPTHSHTVDGCDYNSMFVSCKRTSGREDVLPIVVPHRLSHEIDLGDDISIVARISSREDKSLPKSKHRVFLSVYDIEDVDDDVNNEVELEGYVCTKPYFRCKGSRQISTLMLGTNNGARSYYIPLVLWGKDAVRVSDIDVGSKIRVDGRFQSRVYLNQDFEEDTTYEVSVSNLSII